MNLIKKIYILITHPKNEELKYILKKYDIKQIAVSDECTDYIISVLNNFIISFDLQYALRFKFANDINNILTLIQTMNFTIEQNDYLFQGLTKLFIKIMTTHYDNINYYFTVFRDVPIGILECIFFMLRFQKDNIEMRLVKSLIENILQCFINSSAEDNLAVPVFRECGILLNFSLALEYYFKETLSENITDQFFEVTLSNHPDMLNKFIIELFPILEKSQKNKWEKFVGVSSLEPEYIRFGIINGIFSYDDKICTILINLCRQQVKEKSPKKDGNLHLKPLYCVLRLVEKDFITNLGPYKEFMGYYDFFDFVCFPNDFDYTKYDTSWGSWLILEKYREPAFKTAYETLKKKYEQAMKDGPTDTDKSIYYRYFYSEDNPF
jgi:hypothetical protein